MASIFSLTPPACFAFGRAVLFLLRCVVFRAAREKRRTEEDGVPSICVGTLISRRLSAATLCEISQPARGALEVELRVDRAEGRQYVGREGANPAPRTGDRAGHGPNGIGVAGEGGGVDRRLQRVAAGHGQHT